MYHVTGDTQLRVVRRLTRALDSRDFFKRTRLVALEHALPTTGEFLRLLLGAGVHVSGLIAKPYSVDKRTVKQLRARGVPVEVRSSYSQIESEGLPGKAVAKALRESRRDGKRVIVLDVGGYFAKCLEQAGQADHLAGVIEDTTFGHNMYRKVLPKISVPICSVARSQLKEIEARFVGRDAVIAMERMLRLIGISITGRNALVIGYGMIGRNVARTLKGYDLNVYVYDIEDRKLLHAFNDGFHIHKKQFLLRNADIIFSATGSEALDQGEAMKLHEIDDCKHGVILASVGSRNTEFAVTDLAAHAVGPPKRLIRGTDDLLC